MSLILVQSCLAYYNTKGNTAYIDNSSQYIGITPKLITSQDGAVMQFNSKGFGGSFKIAIGVNNSKDNWMNVTSLDLITEYIVNVNGTNENGSFSYNETRFNITRFNTVNYNFTYDGKTYWYEIQGINISQNINYTLNINSNVMGVGNYSVIGYMNSRTIDWAIAHNQFVYLDPYYNVSGTPTYYDFNLTDNLQFYYTLDELSGDVVDNVTGLIGTSVLSNTTSGIIGSSRLFAPTGSRIVLGDKPFNVTTNMSINAWIKLNASTIKNVIVGRWRSGAGAQSYILRVDNTSLFFDARSQSSEAEVGGYCNLTMGVQTWNMVTVTFNNTHFFLYLNGTLCNITAFNGTGLNQVTGVNTSIGAYQENFAVSVFNGSIDELGLWNRSLNQTEISTLYAIQKDGNPQGSYPFNISYVPSTKVINVTLVSPINNSRDNSNIFNFVVNDTVTNCSLIINNVVNKTNSNADNFTVVMPASKYLVMNWSVNCTASDNLTVNSSVTFNYTFFNATPSISGCRVSPDGFVNSTGNVSFYANASVVDNSSLSYNFNVSKNGVLYYSSLVSCFQQQANESFAGDNLNCSLNYSGGYSIVKQDFYGGFSLSKAFDGDVNSYSTGIFYPPLVEASYLVNYSKPQNITLNNNTYFGVKMYIYNVSNGDVYLNKSVPSICLNQNVLQFKVNMTLASDNSSTNINLSCYNGSSFVVFNNFTSAGDFYLYEDYVVWVGYNKVYASGVESLIYNISSLRSQDNYSVSCQAFNELGNSSILTSNTTKVVSKMVDNVTVYNSSIKVNNMASINLSLNISDYGLVNASLYYNNSLVYNASVWSVGNTSFFSYNFTPTSFGTVNFSWFVIVDNVNVYNLSVYNQTISSLNITINLFDENTSVRLNSFNTTIVMQNQDTFQQYSQTGGAGQLNFSGLVKGEYSISVYPNSSSYYYRVYYFDVSETSNNTLNVYLTSASSVILTYIDSGDGSVVNSVLVGMARIINGTSTIVENKYTDITGRVQFSYAPNVQYFFYSVKQGYLNKTYSLNPIIYSAYNVPLQRSSVFPPQISDIFVSFTPQYFICGGNLTTFNFGIVSDNSLLSNYAFNIYYFNESKSFSGSNSSGDIDIEFLNISCDNSTMFQYLIFYYNYTDVNGKFFEFNRIFTIGYGGSAIDYAQNYTITQNLKKDWQSTTGAFEKVSLATLVTFSAIGVGTAIGGGVFGLVLGILIMGLFIYIFPVLASIFVVTIIVGIFLYMVWFKNSGGRP
jgi:hypothetical protein